MKSYQADRTVQMKGVPWGRAGQDKPNTEVGRQWACIFTTSDLSGKQTLTKDAVLPATPGLERLGQEDCYRFETSPYKTTT